MLSRFKSIVALMRNPKVSKLPKFLVVGAIFYILWPWDVVPDIAPVVGWLDDIMFMVGAVSLLLNAAPRSRGGAGAVIDVTPEPPTPPSGR